MLKKFTVFLSITLLSSCVPINKSLETSTVYSNEDRIR